MKKANCIIYFRHFNSLGGTEQWIYEMAKAYPKRFTLLFSTGDGRQIERFNRYVRVWHYDPNEHYVCRRAYFCINQEAADSIESTENYYAFITHSIFMEHGFSFPLHPKINHVIANSRFAHETYMEHAFREYGIPSEICYNPLSVEEPKRIVKLISACRLDDRIKGGRRTLQLIRELDRISHNEGIPYLWYIFTKETRLPFNSDNVMLMHPRLNVRDFIAQCDWCIQLSDDMETYCYTLNEALMYSKGIVSTGLSVLKEFTIPKDAMITLEFDCSNIEDVARMILTQRYEEFTYEPPNDRWGELLPEGEDEIEEYPLIPIRTTDQWKDRKIYMPELDCIPDEGMELKVTEERCKALMENRYGLDLIDIAQS